MTPLRLGTVGVEIYTKLEAADVVFWYQSLLFHKNQTLCNSNKFEKYQYWKKSLTSVISKLICVHIFRGPLDVSLWMLVRRKILFIIIFVSRFSEDLSTESVEVLRERLSTMKRLMAERNTGTPNSKTGQPNLEELWNKPQNGNPSIIDGNFLSFALCGALVVILTVAVYAFYSLYHAVLKKFPSHHTEL